MLRPKSGWSVRQLREKETLIAAPLMPGSARHHAQASTELELLIAALHWRAHVMPRTHVERAPSGVGAAISRIDGHIASVRGVDPQHLFRRIMRRELLEHESLRLVLHFSAMRFNARARQRASRGSPARELSRGGGERDRASF
jgi:hypothetical protein